MSEFKVEVVRIGKKARHPNADNLEITSVYGKGGYPVIFRSGQFNEGDLAVYVPVDALMPPGNPAWEFLNPDWRIKAKRLRGIFSQGLLLPMSALYDEWHRKSENEGYAHPDQLLPTWKEGDNVQSYLGILKYEEDKHLYLSGDQIACPAWFREYTDIEGWKYGSNKYVLKDGEEVVLREKIHGANGRWAFKDGELWVGSRETARKTDSNNIWSVAARKYELEKRLSLYYPNAIFYGEVYGPKVQKLGYDADPEDVKLRFFDIFDMNEGVFLDEDRFTKTCNFLELDTAPVIYRGPWSTDLLAMAENKSVVAPGQISEGFVVKPVLERREQNVKGGRVIFKVISEQYLLWKSKK